MVITELVIILILVLMLPFVFHFVEKELEIFLFIMGALAVTVSGMWSAVLIKEAFIEPVKITIAVFLAGMIFKIFRKNLDRGVNTILKTVGVKWFVFLVVVFLGILSSVITAIIAALVLVEITSHLKLDKKNEIVMVVLACFSIGMGAALTPIGEPLSTITIAKLHGEPYNAGFWFLFIHLWPEIISAVLLTGIAAAVLVKKVPSDNGLREDSVETTRTILLRCAKVYLFVMALVFLGSGFKILVDMYVSKIAFSGLYWINIISAVLDNATLASAEIGPHMDVVQIKAAIMGLIIAGGFLIPGNIPNIIAANKLKIKSSEWAKIGVPFGMVLMIIYFVIIIVFK
jgi:predicted cation transporter